ncbi:hypothetical protein [Selenomonas ruminantium]|nr:hypothetical protein [Selenomonas ruminantium]
MTKQMAAYSPRNGDCQQDGTPKGGGGVFIMYPLGELSQKDAN